MLNKRIIAVILIVGIICGVIGYTYGFYSAIKFGIKLMNYYGITFGINNTQQFAYDMMQYKGRYGGNN